MSSAGKIGRASVAGFAGTLLVLVLIFIPTSSPAARGLASPEKGRPTVILIDKKSNTLDLAYYAEPEYQVIKTFHTTIGRVVGDKEEEGDLKTPEGIYQFDNELKPPSLKPKFGVLAFALDYPNPFDQMAGRTGSHIMLHATNEPDRLKKDYDSEGCVVVKNEEISEIAPFVRLELTPILIFSDLEAGWRKPLGDGKVKRFFESWVKDWESKGLDAYIRHYHSDFKAQGMNKSAWRTYKGGLNSKYASIAVNPDHVQYYRHPKYTVIVFHQDYHSTYKGGGSAYRSNGTKILYVAEEEGDLKIISEQFTRSAW